MNYFKSVCKFGLVLLISSLLILSIGCTKSEATNTSSSGDPVSSGSGSVANNSGVVTTIAGTGSSGSDNGVSSNASFRWPIGLAIDSAGNIIVADLLGHLIRKIDTSGNVTTLAGTGSIGNDNGVSTAASFNWPYDVAIDSAGNIIVADHNNHLIRKIDGSTYEVTTIAGSAVVTGNANGTGTAASFNGPAGLAIDSAGNIIVTDYYNDLIRKIDGSTYEVSTIAGSGSSGSDNGTGTAASFYSPSGVAIDSDGNIIVADRGNHLIRKIDGSTYEVSTLAGSGSSGSTNGTGTAASFSSPGGVAIDSDGNIIVADSYSHLIRKIDGSTYEVSTIAGSGSSGNANGTGTAASFNRPSRVAIDSDGNIIVSDGPNNLIRKIQ